VSPISFNPNSSFHSTLILFFFINALFLANKPLQFLFGLGPERNEVVWFGVLRSGASQENL